MIDIVLMILNLLLEKFNISKEKIKNLTPTEKARVVAYILMPTLILLISIWAVSNGWLGIDLERAFAISELKTVSAGGGISSSKRGVVVIAEPVQSDYRIPLTHNNTEIWSSLTEQDVQSNNDSLTLNSDELRVVTSFYGVSEPVAIVLDGELGKEIKFRGPAESIEDWRLSSRRNVSLAFWPLAACFLAYGIAVARGAPVVDRDKNDASQIGAEPDKD
jgi:hypothetical protein